MATTYTTILGSDSLSDGRVKINANYLSIESDIEAVQTIADNKVAYSGTVPAVGDLVVAAATDGLSIKKKVFTASQVLESDSNGQPTSAAKGTGYNLNLGTTAGTVLEGSNDALYMKLAGTQTVTGDKTFSGVTRAVTQSQSDNSTKVATTAYVDTGLAAVPGENKSPNTIITTYSYMTQVLMPTTGATANVISNGWVESNAIVAADSGGGGNMFFDTSASADAYIMTEEHPGIGAQTEFRFADIGANPITLKTRIKFGTSPSATEALSWGLSVDGAGFIALEDSTTAHTIRFCLANNTGDKLYAVTSNGSANTNTNVTGALTLTSWLNLAMVITSTSVLFYAGNGSTLSLVATHTTNIPTSTNGIRTGWGIIDNGSQPDMYITPIYISLPTS